LTARRLAIFAASLAAGTLLAGGCAYDDPPAARDAVSSDIGPELLNGADLGGFLDDVGGRSQEPLITSDANFLEEVRRQHVVEDRQVYLTSFDGSQVVTLQVIRFSNAKVGRALIDRMGRADRSAPPLPGDAQVSIGDVESDYAERAALFNKGPVLVRVEVIATGAGAPAMSRRLLTRASREQYAKLQPHRSLPGTRLRVARIKRRMAITETLSAVALLLLVAALTAARDPTTRQLLRIRATGRPALPSHAVDVFESAGSARRRHALRAALRAAVALSVFVAVAVLPLGLVASGAVLTAALFAGDVVTSILTRMRGRRGVAVEKPRGSGLIGPVAGSLSLAIAVLALFVAWFGINTQIIGGPGITDDELGRFRVVCLVAGAGLLVLSRVPLELGRRLAMRRLGTLIGADPRPEVLLLRSFADDRLRIRVRALNRSALDRAALRRWERFEEVLTVRLLEVGPVIAVGKPGERLPPLGAVRAYYGEDEWQRGVSGRMDSAALVVVNVGRTPAVAWEVDRARERRALGRTVFVIPPVASPERRRRLRLLAELLELDAGLLDHDQPGLEVLAVVLRDGHGPALVTSGTRDEISYDLALRSAADLLAGREHAGAPAIADRPVLPVPGFLPRGGRARRPWYLRPVPVICALSAALLLANWAFIRREKVDRYQETVDLPTTTRVLFPVEGSDDVIALGSGDGETVVTVIDAVSLSAERLATLPGAPMHGAARGDWVIVSTPATGTLQGVQRSTGRTWRRKLSGVPQGVAIQGSVALVALTAGNRLAEVRLRDGALLRRTALEGRPYAAAVGPKGPFVSLAAADRIVRLGRSAEAATPVRSPRQVFATAGGVWAVSAADGTVSAPGRRGLASTPTFDLLPLAAASQRYVAAGSRERRTIEVADTRSGKTLRTFRSPLTPQSVAVTDSGRVVVNPRGYTGVGVYAIDRDGPL
jgi:hypothetical protein